MFTSFTKGAVVVLCAGAMLGVANRAAAAQDAGNQTSVPRVATIQTEGGELTPLRVVARASGLKFGDLLTPEAVARALRRLRDLPAASTVRMTAEPIDGGQARIHLLIKDHHMFPGEWSRLAKVGARAGLADELRVDVAGFMGAGEVVTAAWRWSAGRPRVVFGLALPSPTWLPGIMSLDGSWERQSYQTPLSVGARPVLEERRRAGLHLTDWSTSWLRWQTGAAVDRLRAHDDLNALRFDTRDYLALDATLDVRPAGDRAILSATAGMWTPIASEDRFWTGGLLAAWRSTDDTTTSGWSAVTEFTSASRVAPLAVWPGAGTGNGRSGLLRAHPLLTPADVLIGQAFGRDVVHGSLEYARPMPKMPQGILSAFSICSIAGFVDTARAWHRLNGLDTSPLFVDAGAGLRVHILGGVVRVDLAHGLRGGGTTFSTGWVEGWPR